MRAPRAVALSVMAVFALGVAGCSDDSPAGVTSAAGSTGATPTTSGSSAAPSGEGTSAADAAIAKVMGSSDKLPVLASGSGSLKTSTGSSAVVAEVLQVMSSPQATRVTWRLKSASSATANTKSFQLARPPLFDTRLLGLVDPRTKSTLHPYTFVPAGGNGMDNGCACSNLPDSVNATGTVLYAVLPPLPAGTSSVNVTLPGFKPMTDVRVTS